MNKRAVIFLLLVQLILVVSCRRKGASSIRYLDTFAKTESIQNNGGSILPHVVPEIGAFYKYHGFSLPEGAVGTRNWFEKNEYAFSVALVRSDQVDDILKQLDIKESHAPTLNGLSSPNILGYGAWPRILGGNIPTGIKGEGEILFDGFATPTRMFSCNSRTGDRLTVDLWITKDGFYLLRVFTSWS